MSRLIRDHSFFKRPIRVIFRGRASDIQAQVSRSQEALSGDARAACGTLIWCGLETLGEDQHESCYVVEFVGKSRVSLLGYVSVSGEVYKVDRPVSEAPLPNDPDMELVLDESDSSIGEIMVREANGAMHACAQTSGSPEGPMREQSDHATWNSARALPYGEFMASMFLRYVIFANSESAIANTAGVDGLDADMQTLSTRSSS